MYILARALIIGLFAFTSLQSSAAEFADGPIIFGYGKHAAVKQDMKIAKDTKLKVVFDVAKTGKDGGVNRGFDSVARFYNMHVANGIPAQNIDLVVVVHGGATNEMRNTKSYQAKYGKENPNSELINTLLANKVQFVQCGQSAAFHQMDNTDMIEGVNMALSAMTAHAILNAKGYSQNPF
ncbi:DsrE family protein [uncultured Paraglaciecola sp.]|uniref:DsrE family protein n=1 Tax=uncultured Paraglaciecola sp. TaxID=1765024 RepID=UPI002599F2E2|nr:DsrE family protein [uncultured Paraglaciecola sp.]